MQVKVPYITIEQLDAVLASLVDSGMITVEQSAVISGEAAINVRDMIRKSTEQKQANELRQKCYGLARREVSATRSAIARQMRAEAEALGVALADERRDTEHSIAGIRQYRDRDLIHLQCDIDELDRDRLTLDRDSQVYAENIAKTQGLRRRRAEVKATAAADIEKAYADGHKVLKAVHAAYAASQAELCRRMEAATAAYELTRSIIEKAADADLPGIFDELQGKEGGDA